MSQSDALWRTFSDEWSDSSCGTLSRSNSDERDEKSESTHDNLNTGWEPPPLTQREEELARKAEAVVAKQNAAVMRRKRNEDLRRSALIGDRNEVLSAAHF